MQTTFTLIAPDRTPWAEADLDTDAETLARILAGQTALYGMLRVEDEDTDEMFDVVDDLDALISGVCLELVPDLAAGEAATYYLAAHSETVTLTPSGYEIDVEGTTSGDASFDKDQLLRSLVACGRRYVAFKERQWGAQDRRVEKLKAALQRAEQAVGG